MLRKLIKRLIAQFMSIGNLAYIFAQIKIIYIAYRNWIFLPWPSLFYADIGGAENAFALQRIIGFMLVMGYWFQRDICSIKHWSVWFFF